MEVEVVETYEILPSGQGLREAEGVLHFFGGHDLVGPLSTLVRELVDLEPAGAGTGRALRAAVDRPEEEVRDRSRMRRRVPLHCDLVAGARRRRRYARPARPVYVARYVVAVDVGLEFCALSFSSSFAFAFSLCLSGWEGVTDHRAVARRHPDRHIQAGALPVNPELMEVLVRRDDGGRCREEGSGG